MTNPHLILCLTGSWVNPDLKISVCWFTLKSYFDLLLFGSVCHFRIFVNLWLSGEIIKDTSLAYCDRFARRNIVYISLGCNCCCSRACRFHNWLQDTPLSWCHHNCKDPIVKPWLFHFLGSWWDGATLGN